MQESGKERTCRLCRRSLIAHLHQLQQKLSLQDRATQSHKILSKSPVLVITSSRQGCHYLSTTVNRMWHSVAFIFTLAAVFIPPWSFLVLLTWLVKIRYYLYMCKWTDSLEQYCMPVLLCTGRPSTITQGCQVQKNTGKPAQNLFKLCSLLSNEIKWSTLIGIPLSVSEFLNICLIQWSLTWLERNSSIPSLLWMNLPVVLERNYKRNWSQEPKILETG